MQILEAKRRYLEFKNADEKYDVPFPIGVFGTLRTLPAPMANSELMFQKEPVAHYKAFLPHHIARRLKVFFKEGASAPFEIFFYVEEDWKEIIKSLDDLEGFDKHSPETSWYSRTLAELNLLPPDFHHSEFDKISIWEERNLKIPETQWLSHQTGCVPAWIYSNRKANAQANECFQESHDSLELGTLSRAKHRNPILWPREE